MTVISNLATKFKSTRSYPVQLQLNPIHTQGFAFARKTGGKAWSGGFSDLPPTAHRKRVYRHQFNVEVSSCALRT
jgi:hypothetical protein